MSSPTETAVQRKTAYHHGDLRSALIDAVRKLVDDHGPDGFSVSQAARKAGVSTAAPYKHFKDKNEILRAVSLQAMDDLRREMELRANRYPAGSLEAISSMGTAYIDFALAEPGVFRLMFGLTEGHEEDCELRAAGDACFAIVKHQVSKFLDAPEEDRQVQSISYYLWTVVHGHSFLRIDNKTKDDLEMMSDWDFLMDIGARILVDRTGAE